MHCDSQQRRSMNKFLNTLGGWGRSLSQAAYYTKYKQSIPNLCFTYISHSISCRPIALKTKTIYSILQCYLVNWSELKLVLSAFNKDHLCGDRQRQIDGWAMFSHNALTSRSLVPDEVWTLFTRSIFIGFKVM